MDAELRLASDGATHFAGAALPCLANLEQTVGFAPARRAGVRLRDVPGLTALLEARGTIGALAVRLLGKNARPVRGLLLDKSTDVNWALPWHQDRTIAVRERIETDGFGPWTIKDGAHHVEPPAELQAGMITLRVHLDLTDEANAPLMVAPGSHRPGRIAQSDIQATVRSCGATSCVAEAGDIWAYATPILHASKAATRPRRRRVLQVDYAAAELPGRLRWLGV